MSFSASIELEKHKLIWSKSLLALSLLTDEIQFSISPDTVIVRGINGSATSISEIQFNKSFFQDYELDFTGCISQGYDSTSHVYCFIINKQPLSILFKNFDINSTITFKMMFNEDFKLFIDISRKLIVKKYQIDYQPVSIRNDINYALQYINEYNLARSGSIPSGSTDIHYIMMDQRVIKEFVDVIPSSTEEFKIEVKKGRVLFNGFTKSVMKENQYLKQPMSSTISVSIDEVLNSNITGDLPHINFKLKNFKIFINLVNLIQFDKMDNDYFEIYFKGPGDVVLFNLSNNSHVKVNFVQLTNGEGTGQMESEMKISKNYKIEAVNKPEGMKEEIDQIPNLDVEEFNDELEATQYDEVKSIFD